MELVCAVGEEAVFSGVFVDGCVCVFDWVCGVSDGGD